MANPLQKIRLQIVYLKLAVNAIPQPVKKNVTNAVFLRKNGKCSGLQPGAVCYTYTEFLCAEGWDRTEMDTLRVVSEKYGFWLLWLALAAALLVQVRYCTAEEEGIVFSGQRPTRIQGWRPSRRWGGTYFSALIFMPLAAAFHAVTGGYTECVFVLALLLYPVYRGSERGELSAAAAFCRAGLGGTDRAAGLCFYPLNLSTFSYNSMAMHFAMLFVLLALWGAREGRIAPAVLSSAFALTVQAYPP